MAAEVVVPEADHAAYEAELARWARDGGPDNAFEEHLVRRAAVSSVTLERIETAREEGRQEAARKAVASWEKKRQASARRKAQDLGRDPANVVADLEATAFGCEWLIRQWRALDAPLAVGLAWDKATLCRAQHLLGFPAGPPPGRDAEPVVRTLWLLAGAAWPDRIPALGRNDSEARLPTEPDAGLAWLRRFIAEEVDRLGALAEASWEAVEGPQRDAIAAGAAAADVSKAGQLRHRYETAADRSCNAAIRLFVNLRDRRQRNLATLAKESEGHGLLRAPVGGGWWREVDSDPAPPGFARVGPTPELVGVAIDPRFLEPSPIADPPPTTTAATDPDPAPVAEPPTVPASPPDDATSPTRRADELPARPLSVVPGAPRRSEPISPADQEGDLRCNPVCHSELRNEPLGRSPGAPGRTEPRPDPDRPASPASDHPSWTMAPGPRRWPE